MLNPAKSTRSLAACASIAGLALGWTALSFGAALSPAPASADSGPYYRAELAQPAGEATIIARGTAWSCQDTVCAAPKKSNLRPIHVCRHLAKKAGEVTRFTVEGVDFSAEEIADCAK